MNMKIAELFKLEGKVACVTGASNGLGKQAANILLQNGVKVVGVARNKSLLESWSSDAGVNAAFVSFDLTERNKIKRSAKPAMANRFPLSELTVFG